MQAAQTITVPLRFRFVTHGFRLAALALCLLARPGAGAEPEAPPPDCIRQTNVVAHGNLTVHRLTVGTLSANCYVVADREGQALVIDPGASPDSLRAYIQGRGLRVRGYLLTHSHLDHISALDELAESLPAPVGMHPEENDWAFCEKNEWLPAYPRTRPVAIDRPLRHQQQAAEGGFAYTVIHTPGHSPGSVCYWFPREGLIFTGDTLFAGTVGRTDLHRSSSTSLLRSLGIFLMLPTETVIYAGHGEPTAVQAELASNPFLQDVPNPPKARSEKPAAAARAGRTEEAP